MVTLSIPFIGFRIVSLPVFQEGGANTFNSIYWILQRRHGVLLRQPSLNFQFHLLDSRVISPLRDSQLCDQLFQFHLLDSPGPTTCAMVLTTRWRYFQFHLLDSYLLHVICYTAVCVYSFNSIYWILASIIFAYISTYVGLPFNSIYWIPPL